MANRLVPWYGGILCLLLLAGCVPYPIYRAPLPEAPPPVLPVDTLATGGTLEIPASDHRLPRVEPPEPAPLIVPKSGPIDTTGAYQIGYASHYGKKAQGRRTASGERYNPQKLTAAHRLLPLGTRIRVTNLGNGRHVEVWVNDRGPFVRGRIVDLSYAAAEQLEMLGAGTVRVMLELVEGRR